MKTALGIIAVLVLALGVWLSLHLGRVEPAAQPSTEATSTDTGVVEQPVQSPVPLAKSYGNGVFSIQYPAGYTVDEKYLYEGLGPQNVIAGVKFTVSTSTTAGTNLSSDTYLSVEHKPLNAERTCTAGQFLDLRGGAKESRLAYNGLIYSVASSSDAAAGNRYEETVYALYTPKGCIAVRYMVHYGVLENYPQGQVKQFDRAALFAQFDAIRQSLAIVQ